LAESAGVKVVGRLIQKLASPSKIHYLGKGKLEELVKLKETLFYDAVIIDDEISPQQQENLEEILEPESLIA